MVNLPDNRNPPTLNVSANPEDGRNPIPVVLIVDDNEDCRLMLRFLLETWKYKVIEAADGIEAISVAERMRPNLILMDVRLPYLDGFGAVRQIRRSVNTGGVPIIFLSACVEMVYKQQAFAVGGNEYLTKPLDFDELENTLGRYIQH